MATFKKSINLNGKLKGIISDGENFINSETGEVIDLANMLNAVYGAAPFDISTSYKEDEEIE